MLTRYPGRSWWFLVLALGVCLLPRLALSDVTISDFSSVRPLDTLFGSWFWASEFPQLRHFTDGTVQGQETVSMAELYPGIGYGSANVTGGASVNFAATPLDLSHESQLELTARLTLGNLATTFVVSLTDGDGTQMQWSYPATDFNATTFASAGQALAAGQTTVFGATAGFDFAQTVSLTVAGNYVDGGGSAPIRVQLDALTAIIPEPSPAVMLAAGLPLVLLRAWRFSRRPAVPAIRDAGIAGTRP